MTVCCWWKCLEGPVKWKSNYSKVEIHMGKFPVAHSHSQDSCYALKSRCLPCASDLAVLLCSWRKLARKVYAPRLRLGRLQAPSLAFFFFFFFFLGEGGTNFQLPNFHWIICNPFAFCSCFYITIIQSTRNDLTWSDVSGKSVLSAPKKSQWWSRS